MPPPRPTGDETDGLSCCAPLDGCGRGTLLNRPQAGALLLRVVVGLDEAAAARVLGKRPGAVRAAWCRGLKRLAPTARRRRCDTRGPPDDEVPRTLGARHERHWRPTVGQGWMR